MANDQGTIYAAFIDDQLRAERARQVSLDERGARLQQSASVTVGLFVTALGLLVRGDEVLSGLPLCLFVATGLALIGAFLCGIVSTRLVKYEVADVATMARMLEDHWGDTEATSRNITAWLNAKTIERLRPGNNFKAAWLLGGIACQGFGVLFGAAALGVLAAGVFVGGGG